MNKSRRQAGFRYARIAALVVFVTVVPSLVLAQESKPGRIARPLEVKSVLGFSALVDNAYINPHFLAGASVRLGLGGRWSVEPQVFYMRSGPRDRGLNALGSLIYDLETRGRITPYWVVGAGGSWYRETFSDGLFIVRSWHLSAGAGMRIRLGERWTLTSEARLGRKPALQAHAALGYAF